MYCRLSCAAQVNQATLELHTKADRIEKLVSLHLDLVWRIDNWSKVLNDAKSGKVRTTSSSSAHFTNAVTRRGILEAKRLFLSFHCNCEEK